MPKLDSPTLYDPPINAASLYRQYSGIGGSQSPRDTACNLELREAVGGRYIEAGGLYKEVVINKGNLILLIPTQRSNYDVTMKGVQRLSPFSFHFIILT